MQKTKLIFFTSSYPFGRNEPFIANELHILSQNFNNIEIFPFYYNNNITKARRVPDNVKVHLPIIPISKSKRVLFFIKAITKLTPFKYYFDDFLENKVFLSIERLKKWLLSFIDFCILWDSQIARKLNSIENSVFYYYWGTNYAHSLCFLNKSSTNRYFVRLHGGEVYLKRNNGYIPIREKLFSRADKILVISEQLKGYLFNNFQVNKEKIIISRLGTKMISSNPVNRSKEFTFVSVSNLIPLKRVDLIISVLASIKDKTIQWYHFGDGPEKMKLIELATKKLGSNIEFNFEGYTNINEIFKFYSEKPIDAFINLSMFEGVPVSIMEAHSFGIPAIASNVGATAEVVNNKIGALIEKDATIEEIKDILLSTKTLEWQAKRGFCKEHWKMNFQVEVNGLELSKILTLKS
jgi:glycosyltransferase involved in cell wall biosynthesis